MKKQNGTRFTSRTAKLVVFTATVGVVIAGVCSFGVLSEASASETSAAQSAVPSSTSDAYAMHSKESSTATTIQNLEGKANLKEWYDSFQSLRSDAAAAANTAKAYCAGNSDIVDVSDQSAIDDAAKKAATAGTLSEIAAYKNTIDGIYATAQEQVTAAQQLAAAQQQSSASQVSQSSTSGYSAYTGGSIDSIISRESGGDPYATNGQYKGIGQLTESYYQQYLGKSWSEVAGDYNAQLQAMNAYIADRYGSVDAAVAHSNANGWY